MSQLDDLDRAWIAKINRILESIKGDLPALADSAIRGSQFASGFQKGKEWTIERVREEIEK